MTSNVKMMPLTALGRYGIFEKRGRTGVLLVHGITGSPTEMKSLVRKLSASGLTVACPQLAGHCSTLTDLKHTRWTPSPVELKLTVSISASVACCGYRS